MFYKNSNKFDKKMKLQEYIPISFSKGLRDDDMGEDLGSCEIVYNFDYNLGKLTDCCGVGDLYTRTMISPDSDETRKFTYRDDRIILKCFYKRVLQFQPGRHWSLLMFYDNYNEFYYYVINELSSVPTHIPEFDTNGFAGMFFTYVDGVENIMISMNDADTMPMWTPSPYYTMRYIDNDCVYKSMCYFDNRTFATTTLPDNCSVFYSEEFNPTNFRLNNKDTGCVTFDDDLGRCELLIVFEDNLYVFRELGISKIVKNRDKITFDGETVYRASGVIFKDTVCVCGDKIVFLTIDGLFEFDGNNVKQIRLGYEKFLDYTPNSVPIASYLNGIYYLNSRLDYADGELVLGESTFDRDANIIIKYNVKTNQSCICRGFKIQSFAPVLDKTNCEMVIVYNDSKKGRGFGVLDNSGTVHSAKIKKFWKSKPYNFGDAKKYKFIKEMELKTKADITVKLYFDGKEKSISVKGKSTMQTIKINQKAKEFAYGFVSMGGGNCISDIKFVVGSIL